MHLCLVTCSYDTDFEPVSKQLTTKLAQIRQEFEQFTLIVMNDASEHAAFAQAIREVNAPEVILYNVETKQKGKWGMKGFAVREGLRIGLELNADVYAYVNLNLKVDAKFIASGMESMKKNGWEAAFGSRDPEDGGERIGAGSLGELKSSAFGKLARSLLPCLPKTRDTNGPLKLFSRNAAQLIVSRSQVNGAFFDCEWLIITSENHIKHGFFPIIWKQRAGSRPPWRLVRSATSELLETRHRWKAGLYRKNSSG